MGMSGRVLVKLWVMESEQEPRVLDWRGPTLVGLCHEACADESAHSPSQH